MRGQPKETSHVLARGRLRLTGYGEQPPQVGMQEVIDVGEKVVDQTGPDGMSRQGAEQVVGCIGPSGRRAELPQARGQRCLVLGEVCTACVIASQCVSQGLMEQPERPRRGVPGGLGGLDEEVRSGAVHKVAEGAR